MTAPIRIAPVLASLLAARARLLAMPAAAPEVDAALRAAIEPLLAGAVVRAVGRDAPALLEVVRERDAVHPVQSEADLARRLAPDRCICALVHPARPDAALAFIELALLAERPTRIDAILDPGAPILAPARATVGVFYGISNTEPGAVGLAVGSLLIARMLAWLPAHVPDVPTWVTLSPIPKLRAWLAAEHPEIRRGDPGLADLARRFITEVVAPDGRPIDPVARFHLGNGASLDAVLVDAAGGARADAESLGVMASYGYVGGDKK